jgi:plasmid stabilization system protein ParE
MRVRFTKLANSDLNQAYSYIAQDSPSSAQSMIGHIEKYWTQGKTT